MHLQTMFRFGNDGRIVSTREPGAVNGPVFWLARGHNSCAWAVRRDTPDRVARELAKVAADEPLATDFRAPPIYASRYQSLIDGIVDTGTAFHFPASIAEPTGVAFTNTAGALVRHFPDWRGEEIEGRTPIAVIEHDGSAISVCCCARRSDLAAEAGLETAPAFRGRGLAARVTAAWALAVRASGRIPLYSTSWNNAASMAVAHKLGLKIYASVWSLSDAVSGELAQLP